MHADSVPPVVYSQSSCLSFLLFTSRTQCKAREASRICGHLSLSPFCSPTPFPAPPFFPPFLTICRLLPISLGLLRSLPPIPDPKQLNSSTHSGLWAMATFIASGSHSVSNTPKNLHPRYKYSHMPGPAPCLRVGAGLPPQARQVGHMPHKCHRTTSPSQHPWGNCLGPALFGCMSDGWISGGYMEWMGGWMCDKWMDG